ncbi:hypothetical protein [Magnetospirillum sp. UT-4]|uniref:hypothetical protein n=1 Tax=Magnetospirillum sp. UT-4 TaxID=2681467 RepID=UPI0013807413
MVRAGQADKVRVVWYGVAWALAFSGASAMAVLYSAMRVLSFRLPLGLVFPGTAALLFFLAVSFAGKGMLELQEGRLVSITPLDWMPRVEWLGLFPTLESVAAQMVLLLPMAAALAWLALRRRKAAASRS